MGVDVQIYVRAKPDFAADLADTFAPPGATHELTGCERYFGYGQTRGNWPRIWARLVELLADPDVETIWYGGDTSDTPPEIVTLDTLALHTAAYIAGRRT